VEARTGTVAAITAIILWALPADVGLAAVARRDVV
jgi:hypothetical protein